MNTANHTDFFKSHRVLTFTQLDSERETMSLAIADLSMDQGRGGVYKIPLYEATPIERTQEPSQTQSQEQASEAEIELVHLYPLIHNSVEQEKEHVSLLPDGYLYVYVNGYLWRELKVEYARRGLSYDRGKCRFRDINLGIHRGNDDWVAQAYQRQATGEPLPSILVPNKLSGQQTCVEIAYSETQWCWDYLLKLGGMDPLDPRLESEPALSFSDIMCPDEEAAKTLRRRRMQHLDNLDEFKGGFSNSGTVVSGSEFQSLIDHESVEQLAVVALTNGLHLMRRMAAAIQVSQSAIQYHLNTLQSVDLEAPDNNTDDIANSRYELACMMVQTFYYKPDAILNNEIDIPASDTPSKNGETKSARELAADLAKWRSSELDEEAFWDYLGYDKMMALANETAALRQQLIEFLNDIDSQGNFTACFEDYGYYQDVNFNRAGEVIEVLASVLKSHPAHLFAHLIREQADWQSLADEDEGQDFLLCCLDQHPQKPSHPISRILCPESLGESLSQYRSDAEPRFSPLFYPGKVKLILDSEAALSATDISQLGRRFSQMMLGLSLSLFEIPATLHQMSASGYVSLNQTIDDKDLQLARVQQNIVTAEQRKQQFEDELAQTQNRLKDVEQHHSETVTQQQQRPASKRLAEIIARQKAQLVQEKTNLKRLNQQLTQVHNRIENSKITLKRIQKVTRTTSGGKTYAVFDGARTHAFLNVLRLVDIAESGRLIQMEMLAEDYLNGNFPEGYSPLDPALHQRVAKKRLRELKTLQRTDNRRLVNAHIPGLGAQQIPLEDIFQLNGRLQALTTLLKSAAKAKEHESQHRINVYLVKLEQLENQSSNVVSFDNDKAEQEPLQTKINAIANDIDGHQQAALLFGQQKQHLERLAAKPIPRELNLNQMRKGMFGLLAVVGVFEVMNLKASVEDFFDKPSLKIFATTASAVIDSIAIFFTINSAVAEVRSGLLSTQQLNQYFADINRYGENSRHIKKSYSDEFKGKAKLMELTARVNLIASVIGTGIAGYDSYYAMKRGDTGASVGWGLVTLGSVGLGIETLPVWLATLGRGWVFHGFARLGPLSLLLIFAGYGIYYFFADKPLQTWLKESPWGTHAYQGGESDHWKEQPGLAKLKLYELLMSPKIRALTSSTKRMDTRNQVAAHGYSGEAFMVRFDLSMPGHDPNIGMAEIYLEYKDGNLPEKGYQTLASLTETVSSKNSNTNSTLPSVTGKGGLTEAIDYFWSYVDLQVNPQSTGFILSFYEGALYPLFKYLNTDQLIVRLRCCHYPKGQNEMIGPGREVLRLPHSDLSGKEITNDGAQPWIHGKVELETGDYLSPWIKLIRKAHD